MSFLIRRCTLKSELIFGNWKCFKNDKNWFLFQLKLKVLLVLKKFQFWSWLFGNVEKRFDQKDKVMWINSHFIQFVFIVCQVRGYQNYIKIKLQNICFNFVKSCLKNKNRFRTSTPASFFTWFFTKNFYVATSH